MLYVAADLHLAPQVWKNMPSMRGDSYAALDQIVDVCCRGGKQTSLVLCGDIFDKTHPDSQSVDRFRIAMDNLRAHAVDVYVIQGQHEKADPPWASALGAAKYIGDGKPVKLDIGDDGTYQTLTVVGHDYTNTVDLKKWLKSVKKADILFLHQMAKQAIDIDGAWDFDIDWVNKGVKLVIAGDYHEILNVGRLWYPGSTSIGNITETNKRHFLQVNSKDLSVTPIQLTSRQLIEVRAANEDQLTEAVATITDTEVALDKPDEIATPLVIARYAPGVKDVVSRIELACQDRAFLLRLKPLVDDVEQEATEMPTADATLQACLDALVNRDQDEELHAFVSSLLASSDTRAVLNETKQQLGIGG